MNSNDPVLLTSANTGNASSTSLTEAPPGGTPKASPRRVLTNTSSSGSDPLASPSNETVTDFDGHLIYPGTFVGGIQGSPPIETTSLNSSSIQAQLMHLERHYHLQKQMLNRQYEEEQRMLEHEQQYKMQMLLLQKQHQQQIMDDTSSTFTADDANTQRTPLKVDRWAQLEHIKHKRKDEESAVASTAVKLKLRECLLNKSHRELHNISDSPPEFRQWSTQHSSLEQHSPPTTEWSPPLKLNLGQYDDEYPLRKTVSEPSLKMRSSKLSLRQKVIQRNSQLMRRREVYRKRVPATLDHDDSPNSPPSAVSSQGSSVDISITREDQHTVTSERIVDESAAYRPPPPINMAALSGCDAELMLAMSRTYGSLPLMGCWPPTLPPIQTDAATVEAQMKVLELVHHTETPRLPYQPTASNVGHMSDAYMQALMARSAPLPRTRSEPIPLPVQLLLQQHKMLLNKQQDQQLKENHKLYLKKKLLHQASAKKLHMEHVDEVAECRLARDRLFTASESEEEADVIVIDESVCESDDSAIQPDSGRPPSRPRRAFLNRTRARTLSGGGGPVSSVLVASDRSVDRVSLERGHSLPAATLTTIPKQLSTTAEPHTDKRQFITGLAYDAGMLKHSCICQNESCHPENPCRLVSLWQRFVSTGLTDKCEMVKCRRATREELQTCHSETYVHMYASSARHREPAVFELFAPRFCKLPCGGIGVDMDTVWNEDDTVQSARLAAGCTIELAFKVACGEVDNGFAVVRPPGHHAEDTQAMGFCYFNSIGIAAKLLLERLHLHRILIVDWDVHHGNSTQQLFYADSRVLYISLHRYDDGNFFPGTGACAECGIDRGVGFTVNVAWAGAMMGDAEYLAAFRTIVMPIARDFRPELVLVSAGFDAAIGHPAPLGGYRVGSQCFGHMTQQLMTLVDRKVALVLEGGYEMDPLCDSAEACLRALLNEKIELPMESELQRGPCQQAVETLKNVIKSHIGYWPCIGKYAETLDWSYLEAQHRQREEAETLSALAGLSVVSASTSTVAIDSIQERPDSTTDIAEESEPMEES